MQTLKILLVAVVYNLTNFYLELTPKQTNLLEMSCNSTPLNSASLLILGCNCFKISNCGVVAGRKEFLLRLLENDRLKTFLVVAFGKADPTVLAN